MSVDQAAIKNAQDQLDLHLREIIQWHFSPETGCPFWLDWAGKAGWDDPAMDDYAGLVPPKAPP